MMQTDVKSTYLTAPGYVFEGPCRVKGFIVATNSDGLFNLTIKDGDSTGTVLFQTKVPNVNGMATLLFPGEGISFKTAAYADSFGGGDVYLTVFYG